MYTFQISINLGGLWLWKKVSTSPFCEKAIYPTDLQSSVHSSIHSTTVMLLLKTHTVIGMSAFQWDFRLERCHKLSALFVFAADVWNVNGSLHTTGRHHHLKRYLMLTGYVMKLYLSLLQAPLGHSWWGAVPSPIFPMGSRDMCDIFWPGSKKQHHDQINYCKL